MPSFTAGTRLGRYEIRSKLGFGGMADVYLAMQYVDGVTLAARMARSPLELPELLRLATEITDAVADAHAHGIMHRDLKPANVMLTSREQAKVLDFGLAKVGSSGGSAET